MTQPFESTACPGLFYATSAQDGRLSRIRTPGGLISSLQARAIAHFAATLAGAEVQVTNRANIQVRSVRDNGLIEALAALQQLELAAKNATLDQLRNIMISPTAGIDPTSLINVCPIVEALDTYLTSHPELGKLSAKFSIGLDGGEALSVRDRPNDIWLMATSAESFRLYLSSIESDGAADGRQQDGILDAAHETSRSSSATPASSERSISGIDSGIDTGIQVRSQDVVDLVAAIAHVYLESIDQVIPLETEAARRRSRKPRLREVLAQFGLDWFLEQICDRTSIAIRTDRTSLDRLRLERRKQFKLHPVGIYPQADPSYAYCGIALPLGRLMSWQLEGLATLADRYGDGQLRLTPWQNILLPNVLRFKSDELQQKINQLNLSTSPSHPWNGLVACVGSAGCTSSATATQQHALGIAHELQARELQARELQARELPKRDRPPFPEQPFPNHPFPDPPFPDREQQPINIHFSGCPRSCAQHHSSDIAFLGIPPTDPEIPQSNAQTFNAQTFNAQTFNAQTFNAQTSTHPSSYLNTDQYYEVFIGTGETPFGRPLQTILPANEIPHLLTHLFTLYQDHHHPNESFQTFINRQSLRKLLPP